MSDHIPAWKKIGLKQKASATTYDPLKENIKRTAEQAESTGPKKPPKRAKLPKSERAPPPEPDQLAYLRIFHEDKSNWKFSKQKQNWLLKNLFTIDSKYEEALQKYFGEIKGASRDRLVDEAKDCIKEWNEFMSKPLESEAKDESEDDENEDENDKKDQESEKEPAKESKNDTNDSKKQKSKPKAKAAAPEPKPPTEMAARRAQWFVEHLTGSKPELVLLE